MCVCVCAYAREYDCVCVVCVSACVSVCTRKQTGLFRMLLLTSPSHVILRQHRLGIHLQWGE